MTSAELENLARIGTLKREPPSAREQQGLLASARDRLADTAYQNARVDHDKALARVMTAILKDGTALFKQFMDNEPFRRWLTDTVFGLT